MSRRIGVGDSLPVEELASWLLERGMMRSEVVEVPGEFSLRGGIFDVFPTDATEPVRIEFFGDEVESIRPFDAESQRSLDRWDNVTITIPPSYDEKNRASFGPPTDFFPGGTWVALIEPGDVREEGRHYLGRIDDPRGLYSVESTFERLIRFPSIAVSTLAAESLEATCHLRIESVERFSGDLARVKAELDGAAAGDRVLIACHNAAEVERLGEVFSDTTLARQGRLHRAVGRIRAGFHLIDASTLVIADHELFARADIRRPVTRRRYESRAIDSFLDLNEGDLVVHVNHGIARYRGLQFVDQSAEHAEETLLLEFAEGTKLYVPIAKIDLVQKYVGGGKGAPVLSKIGSSTWEKRKKRVAEAVVDLAQELLDIHAQRASQPGFAYPAEDSHWMAEFEAAFPFEETPDQLTAIEATKHDMAEQKPMDRLICGDVGYGKTEIAIRAAFKAVDAGKQVAVLVPTTILAEQHHRSFSARMGEFPFHIEVVNRFRPRSEVREVLKRGCRRGRHPDRHAPDPPEGRRVQGPGAGGHRRGAAVRGRGQGVAEDLPFDGRRTDALGNADSADPAHEPSGHPRHLQPGDSAPRSQGDRDQDQPVRSRDHQAGHPSRAEPRRPGLLRAQPDLRHRERGRPHPVDRSRGEDRHRPRPDQRRGPRSAPCSAFIRRKFDILVATTIIESGLDIPNVNTIFINEADKYGLADLHQLRGRVGRYKHRAYAYLLLESDKPVTPDAVRRLKAIEEFTSLGAGSRSRCATWRSGARKHPGARAIGPHRKRRLRALLLAAGIGRPLADPSARQAALRLLGRAPRGGLTCPRTTYPAPG